jgi:hypothetical protein
MTVYPVRTWLIRKERVGEFVAGIYRTAGRYPTENGQS